MIQQGQDLYTFLNLFILGAVQDVFRHSFEGRPAWYDYQRYTTRYPVVVSATGTSEAKCAIVMRTPLRLSKDKSIFELSARWSLIVREDEERLGLRVTFSLVVDNTGSYGHYDPELSCKRVRDMMGRLGERFDASVEEEGLSPFITSIINSKTIPLAVVEGGAQSL